MLFVVDEIFCLNFRNFFITNCFFLVYIYYLFIFNDKIDNEKNYFPIIKEINFFKLLKFFIFFAFYCINLNRH